jgi:hypothetical protein
LSPIQGTPCQHLFGLEGDAQDRCRESRRDP